MQEVIYKKLCERVSMMNKRAGKSAIIHIADREGKKVEEIKEEICKAIDIAYASREKHPKWGEMFGNRKPSPEEFIEIIALKIAN